jgi:multiple sugar transport system ATP-binding protein
MASVTFFNLEKTFIDSQTKKQVSAVNNLNLEIHDGEFLVLVGPSGCGKSTALRMLAGLEEATSGEIRIGEIVVNDVDPRDRNIAMVFQNYALYPHMSVYDNMAFGLRQRLLPGVLGQIVRGAESMRIKTEIDEQIHEAAELLGITHLLERKPKALSGGQRQRVALGRAIVRHPEVFLMDEPLSNLDAKLRIQTRAELIKLHRRLGVTTIYVTHDQVEAMTMGQRIAVMKDGVLQQCDAPLNIYHHPANMFVAGFIGTPSMNFLEMQVEAAQSDGRPVLAAEGFRVHLPAKRRGVLEKHDGKTVVFGIRPEDIHDSELVPPSAADRDNVVRMTVDVIEPMGSTSVLYVRVGPHIFVAQVDANTKAREGDSIDVVIDTAASHAFDRETETAIG